MRWYQLINKTNLWEMAQGLVAFKFMGIGDPTRCANVKNLFLKRG